MLLSQILMGAAALPLLATSGAKPTEALGLPSAAVAPPGNVLLIHLDDVGVDLIGAYESWYVSQGRERGDPANTPAIDELLAAQGILFTECWTAPMCTPSRARLLTGKYGMRNGVGAVIKETETSGYLNPGLSASQSTLPQALRLGGSPYTSVAVGKWHLVDSPTLSALPDHPLGSPTGTWFDRYAGAMFNLQNAQPGAGINVYSSWIKTYCSYLDPNIAPCPSGMPPCEVMKFAPPVANYATVDTTEDALSMVASLPEPWFLYVAYNAVHAPVHDAPSGMPTAQCGTYVPNFTPCYPGSTPTFASRVRCMMEELDNQIGRLLCSIDAADTTVILISDNGTDPNGLLPPHDRSTAKGTIKEGGIRVPMIIRSPLQGPSTPGRVSRALVSSTDIFATVLAIAGQSVPAGTATDSVSMLPYITGFQGSLRKFVYSENFFPNFEPDPVTGGPPASYVTNRHVQAIREQRFKLVRRTDRIQNGGNTFTVIEEFYDLLQGGPPDPVTGGPTPDWFEENNLLASGLPLAARAQRALQVLRSKLDTQYPSICR
jgi:arylsulfatase A-like enzyme